MSLEQFLPELTRPLAREIFADLCKQLPDRPDETPEARAMREELAIAAVSSLFPADVFEAKLANRIVAADAHCAENLREAARFGVTDPDKADRCRRQAASMARTSDSALRALKRMQAVRDKQLAEMHPAAMERAGYWFRDCSAPAPAPRPALTEAPPPHDDGEEPTLTPEQVEKEVRLYAAIYPDRAKRILAAGGLPADIDFGPPDPYIVAGLLRGVSPTATQSHERAL